MPAARFVMRSAADVSAEFSLTSSACLWCTRPFTPRRGGKVQRFCCPDHRVAFHCAARRWTERAVMVGLLSVAELRRQPQARPGNVHVALSGGFGLAATQVAPEAF